MNEILHKRSAWNFIVFLIFALWMTMFLINKAEETIQEIQEMQDTSVFLKIKDI